MGKVDNEILLTKFAWWHYIPMCKKGKYSKKGDVEMYKKIWLAVQRKSRKRLFVETFKYSMKFCQIIFQIFFYL